MNKSQKLLLTCLTSLFLSSQCLGNVAVLGGVTYQDPYVFHPLANRFRVGKSKVHPVSLPGTNNGLIETVATSSQGFAILAGQDDVLGIPLVYRMDILDNKTTLIPNPNANLGIIYACGINSKGTSVVTGFDNTLDAPLGYLLPPNSSTYSIITFPGASHSLFLNLAIAPDDSILFIGFTIDSYSPVVYRLPPHSLVAERITVPDSATFLAVAIGKNGNAVLGGEDSTTGLPAIYRLKRGAFEVEYVELPNQDKGLIYACAIDEEETAILGGQSYEGIETPLIYRLPKHAKTASQLPPPRQIKGAVLSIGVGPDQTALLGGTYLDGPSLLYRLPRHAPALLPVSPADARKSYIATLSIDSHNTAVLAGQYEDTQEPLLWTLAPDRWGAVATTLEGIEGLGYYTSSAVYTPLPRCEKMEGLFYDPARLQAGYEEIQIKAKKNLNPKGS